MLLLKPGHYEMLTFDGPPPIEKHAQDVVSQASDEVVNCTKKLCNCLETIVLAELWERKQRSGSCPEFEMYAGQLASILDPLSSSLQRLKQVAAPPEVLSPPGEAEQVDLLPQLLQFLAQGQQQPTSQNLEEDATSNEVKPFAPAPRDALKGRLPGVVITETGEALSATVPKLTEEEIPDPTPPKFAECVMCCSPCNIDDAITAECGCIFHPNCLLEYAKEANCKSSELTCFLHESELIGVKQLLAVGAEDKQEQEIIDDEDDEVFVPDDSPGECRICAFCFMETPPFRNLHCGASVHPDCLKKHFEQTCKSVCRVENIDCLVPGCGEQLTDSDMKGIISKKLKAQTLNDILEIERQNNALIEQITGGKKAASKPSTPPAKESSKPSRPLQNNIEPFPALPTTSQPSQPSQLPTSTVWSINKSPVCQNQIPPTKKFLPPPTSSLLTKGKPPTTSRFLSGLGTGLVHDPDTQEPVRLVTPGTSLLRPDKPAPPLTGVLGDNRPCAICYEMIPVTASPIEVKRLPHCDVTVHVSCLKNYWNEQVRIGCKIECVRCPGSVSGCVSDLLPADIDGIIESADKERAKEEIAKIQSENEALIKSITSQHEKDVATFECAICMTEHTVDGAITLPCLHRFCGDCLAQHFDIIVSERRLDQLRCPLNDCNYCLRSEEHIPIFQHLLEPYRFDKLLEFLARDIKSVIECPHCEDKIFVDDGDDFTNLKCTNGHEFCQQCEYGPHPGVDCTARREQIKKEEVDQKDKLERKHRQDALQAALDDGWKPCPMRCKFGGGYKLGEECDHVTCECGFEFCWDCGASRSTIVAHDNRWHKPKCRYYTDPNDVKEEPKLSADCPLCEKSGVVCPFLEDDGYPESYLDVLGFQVN